MIKVLHILSTTSASRGDTAVVMNYFRNIDRKVVMFDFATINIHNDKLDDEINSFGGKVYNFTKPGLRTFSKTIKDLNHIITYGNYDIIHLHIPIFQLFVKKAMKSTNCKKLIIHSHSTKLSSEFIYSVRNRIMLTGLNNGVSARFACSKPAGENLFGKSFGKNQNDVIIYNAIDLNKFKYDSNKYLEIRKNLNISKNEMAVCHVGRFETEKNHDRLIDIFYELYKRNNKYKLFLIGEGSLKNKLKEKVFNLGLTDCVCFLGNRKDVSELLKAMDIFIFPSFFEGLGMALIEAQAAGLLCFAAEGCPEESVITKNVYRLPLSQSNEYWVNFILQKYTNGWNRNTINAVKKSNYDIFTQVNNLCKIYKQIKL